MGGNSFRLAELRGRVKPFRLHWFPRLRSTNDHAAWLRSRGELFAPAIVLAGRQTAGRGRGRNAWWSASGCVTVTFVVPIEEHLSVHQLPLIAGLAVRHAAAELTGAGERIGLKWPNDVVGDGRKLAGLLCERVHKADIIGVGLNVNLDLSQAPAGLRPGITSLRHLAGRNYDLTEAVAVVAAHLRQMLNRRRQHPYAGLLHEYAAHHCLNGQRITVALNGRTSDSGVSLTGRCEGIDDMGRLLLRSEGTVHRIVSGSIQKPTPVDRPRGRRRS